MVRSSCVTLMLLAATAAHAADIAWTNPAGGNWNVAANWSPAMVPGMNDTARIELAGTYTVTLDVDATVAGLVVGGASGTQTLANTNRTLTLNGAGTIGTRGVYSLAGTTTGGGTLSIAGAVTWSGGSLLGTGAIQVQAGGTLTVSGSSSKVLRRTLTNAGMVIWGGSGAISGGDGRTFTNQAGATFDIRTDVQWSWGAGAQPPQLVNEAGATLRKSAGAGTATLAAVLTHAGTLLVEVGTLTLSGGGSVSAPLTVAAGALLVVNTGTVTLNTGAALAGDGPTRLSGGTLAVAAPVSATHLELAGGTIDGAGTLTIASSLAWSAGSMVGGGATAIAPAAVLTLSSSSSKVLRRTLTNAGMVIWGGSGNINGGDGRTFTNQAGATLDIQSDAQWSWASGAQPPLLVNEAGAILRKSTGPGTTTLNAVLTHAGTLLVEVGTLTLSGGGSVSAPLTVAAGALLVVNTGTVTLNAGAALAGDGPTRLSGGTLAVAAPVSAAHLELAGGTIDGAGPLTIASSLAWSAGSMVGGGATAIAPAAGLTLSGSSSKVLRRTLTNAGMVIWGGSGNINGGDGRTFTNQAGATLDIQSDAQWAWASGAQPPQLVNEAGATLRKSTGPGTTTLNAVLTHAGTVLVEVGTLTLSGSGSASAPLTVAAGALLVVNTGTVTLNAGAALGGDGPTRLSGGTLAVAAAVSATHLELAGGTIDGAGTLTIASSLAWSAGSMVGGGAIAIAPAAGLTLSSTSSKVLRRTLTNAGMVIWGGSGGINGGDGRTFTNQAGATLDIQSDAPWSWASGAQPPLLVNEAGAILRKSAGAGTTALSGGTTNAGTVNASSGTLAFNGGYTQNAGATHLAGGHLAGGSGLTIQGGVLDGSGNVAADVVNGGAVAPGLSTGRIVQTGNYNQLGGGAFNVELNGPTPGTEHDRLDVAGTVTLAGALNVSLGFAPAEGTGFTLIDNNGTDAVSGTFSGLAEGAIFMSGGTTWRISYSGGSGNDVVLTAGGGAPVTSTPSATPPSTATRTASRTPTATAVATASAVATATTSPAATASASGSPTATASPTATRSATATGAASATSTATASATATPSSSAAATLTATASPTASPSVTATASASATAIATSSVTVAPASPTPTATVGRINIGGGVYRPGPGGLVGVGNALVSAYICDRRTLCLGMPPTPVATAVTSRAGTFAMSIPADPFSRNMLLFDVTLDGLPFRHLLVRSPRPGALVAGTPGEEEVRLDPVSEAAVRVLEMVGLEHLDDDGIVALGDAVRDANADTSFAGLSVADAANLATTQALEDPTVQTVIEARTTPTPRAACAGDCNGDGTVTVDELVRGVGIALGSQGPGACPAVDRDGDGAVSISELIAAVSSALSGCAQ